MVAGDIDIETSRGDISLRRLMGNYVTVSALDRDAPAEPCPGSVSIGAIYADTLSMNAGKCT